MKRLIHASSEGVYDLSNPPEKIDEEWRSNGAGRVYQASKVACDEVLTAYAAYYDFELALPRFASVYGYGPYTGGGNVGIDMHAMSRRRWKAASRRWVPASLTATISFT